MPMYCQGITKKGNNCRKIVKKCNGYCHLHRADAMIDLMHSLPTDIIQYVILPFIPTRKQAFEYAAIKCLDDNDCEINNKRVAASKWIDGIYHFSMFHPCVPKNKIKQYFNWEKQNWLEFYSDCDIEDYWVNVTFDQWFDKESKKPWFLETVDIYNTTIYLLDVKTFPEFT